MQPLIHSLPIPSSSLLASFVAKNPHSHWLDSAVLEHPRSRYSVLALPLAIVEWSDQTQARLLKIVRESEFHLLEQQNFVKNEGWDFLEVFLQRFQGRQSGFWGGLLGFISYEVSSHLFAERFPAVRDFLKPFASAEIPPIYFSLVDTGLLIDHWQQQSWVYSWGIQEDLIHTSEFLARKRVDDFLDRLNEYSEKQLILPKPKFKEDIFFQRVSDQYIQNFETIHQAIQRGDCYQVNLSEKFLAQTDKSPAEIYHAWRQRSPAPQMAFLNLNEFQILSASPETFFEVESKTIRSFPIKGTRPKQVSISDDKNIIQDLIHHEKDQAELLMIVDLIRNDLGQLCETGSVQVTQLKGLESFAQVHHLVAQIEGKLSEQNSILKALRWMSPGGSITGAPKSKAIEYIARLEKHRREIYTGSIGFIGFNGQAHFNLAIRTAVLKKNQLEYCAGSGIVVDSEVQNEFQEILDKARAFFEITTP